MNKVYFGIMAGLLLAFDADAALRTQEINHEADGITMHAYLAWDDAVAGQRPGVLVVHEWWGHNAYARRRVEDLARLGYTALAVDMYGDGKTADHPEQAGQFAGAVMSSLDGAKTRFDAALAVLKQHDTVADDQTAAIGYCFGGGVVLNMARMGADLDVVASFHGSLAAMVPAQADEVSTRIAVYNGADDPFVTAEQIAAFKQEMEAAKIDYQFINYPATVHSFSNPDAAINGEKFNLPLRYNRLADESSWRHFQLLLQDTFAGE